MGTKKNHKIHLSKEHILFLRDQVLEHYTKAFCHLRALSLEKEDVAVRTYTLSLIPPVESLKASIPHDLKDAFSGFDKVFLIAQFTQEYPLVTITHSTYLGEVKSGKKYNYYISRTVTTTLSNRETNTAIDLFVGINLLSRPYKSRSTNPDDETLDAMGR